MPTFVKGLLFALSPIPFIMVACTSPAPKTQPVVTAQRLYIPQEQVTQGYAIDEKKIPASYLVWLDQGDNRQRVGRYEQFLARNGVDNVVPNFELLKTARDWQRCGRTEFAVPPAELWGNALPTLRIIKSLVNAKILTDFEVTSVYRDSSLNQCAGGAGLSKHVHNAAIDFRIGPEFPSPQDYAFIENTKFRLCQYWRQHGPSLNMGMGIYASGQIHIDSQGFRTWGPNLSGYSSMCNF